jgi:CBS domain-containing protein
MPLGEFCTREVVTASVDTSVYEAAQLMRHHHVGTVVVVQNRDGRELPVGIITDRDIVLEIVAPGLDPEVLTIGDIMSAELMTVKESVGLFEAIQQMRTMAVRRLPIVSDSGDLVGIVTLDDLLGLLSEELHALARMVTREQQKEIQTRR